MKKLLTITMAIMLAMPQQGYALPDYVSQAGLRPMADQNSFIDIAERMQQQYEDIALSLRGALIEEPITDFHNYIKIIADQVITKRTSKKRLFVIAIDGNSGAAKTTTATELAQHLINEHGKKAVVIERDWFIDSRYNRYSRQDEELSQQEISIRDNEISLRIEKFTVEVLEKLKAFNNSANSKMRLELTELYDKYGGGGLTRTESIEMNHDTIVIIEGNFLLIDAWKKYFDFNVLMLAEPSTGLKRRLPRDHHSDSERVRNIFWRINTPSFIDYLQNLKGSPDLIVRTDSWNIGNQFQEAGGIEMKNIV